jgi:SurA N-terminal domain
VTRIRLLVALGAVLMAGAGLSACGGITGDAVVQVDGAPITKATFAHWMKIAKAPSKPGARYQAAKAEVLGFLISADWLIGESSSLGVKLSDEEVKRELIKEKVAEFPEPAKFRAYLKSSGETVSDVLLNLKVHLLGQKLEQRALKGKSQTAKEKAFETFVKAFRKKWTAKTECRAGYVVEDCKQYKAPKPAPTQKPAPTPKAAPAPKPAPTPKQSKAPQAK